MTFAYNMFILAILASAAGVRLLPAPDAIVSPVFIPRSCQISSQTAEDMLRPRWESGAGEAACIPPCILPSLHPCWVPWPPGLCPGGLLPALPRAAVPAAEGPPPGISVQAQTWGCRGLVEGRASRFTGSVFAIGS